MIFFSLASAKLNCFAAPSSFGMMLSVTVPSNSSTHWVFFPPFLASLFLTPFLLTHFGTSRTLLYLILIVFAFFFLHKFSLTYLSTFCLPKSFHCFFLISIAFFPSSSVFFSSLHLKIILIVEIVNHLNGLLFAP